MQTEPSTYSWAKASVDADAGLCLPRSASMDASFVFGAMTTLVPINECVLSASLWNCNDEEVVR